LLHCHSAGFLSLIVERAKKCLDFAFTNHFLHLMACSAYEVRFVSPCFWNDVSTNVKMQSVPSNWEWWALNAASLIILAVVGMCLFGFACLGIFIPFIARILD